MDFDRERELEDAGIDAFEFSLMDERERREVLRDNFLDTLSERAVPTPPPTIILYHFALLYFSL